MKKQLSIFLTIFVFWITPFYAQQFDDYFVDNTLRLDYIFAGNTQHQQVFLHEKVQLNGWHGRRKNLSITPIQGQGQIRVYDQASGQLIYVKPFGSLFQEWLTLDEAKTSTKSFENTFLVPYPKEKVMVEVVLFDQFRNEKSMLKHLIDPKDILIRKAAKSNIVDYEVIHAAKIDHPIQIAIVAEGFQSFEMPAFMRYAKKVCTHLFSHKIFEQYEDAFEIIAVKTVSQDSGVSVPSQNIWRSTTVQSHFDTFYSSRYLTTTHVQKLHNTLENIPYQHLIILANTEVYGGGGILNAYTLTMTANSQFAPVVVHEFGHSFAGLADEYFYESDVFEHRATQKIEPWEKNISSLVDFDAKWKNMLAPNTPIPTPDKMLNTVRIGAFEGLKGNGLYIPSHDCRMKTNQANDFCPVCNRAIEEMILFYTSNLAN